MRALRETNPESPVDQLLKSLKKPFEGNESRSLVGKYMSSFI